MSILLLALPPPRHLLSLPVSVLQNKEKCRKSKSLSVNSFMTHCSKKQVGPQKERHFLKNRDLFPRQLGFWEMPSVMSAVFAKSLWQHLQGRFQAPKCLSSLFVSSLNKWNFLIHQKGLLVPAFILTKSCFGFKNENCPSEKHASNGATGGWISFKLMSSFP